MNAFKLAKKSPNAENNLSKTGYRALFLLLKLIEGPKTTEELISLVSVDPILKNDISKDTITLTVNTLRKAGCVIVRPTWKSGSKYILKAHPFNTKLTYENIAALQTLRESISTLGDWQLLILVNKLYAKIAHLAPDSDSKDLLLYKHALKNVDYQVLNELILYSKLNKTVNFCYDCPKHGLEDIDFTPEKITFENEKLYVWGYHQKHNKVSFLRIDRISQVCLLNDTKIEEKCIPPEENTGGITYKLKGYSATMYSENNNEVIIYSDSKSEYPLTIRAYVENRFNFFQRLLSYGTDCVITAPESAKRDFVRVLRDIKEGYINEKY